MDFNVGDLYEHRPGRSITDSDNIKWLTDDDEHAFDAARRALRGQRLLKNGSFRANASKWMHD